MANGMDNSIFMRALASTDVSNIMSEQMQTISKSNYIYDNSDVYVDNNIFVNANSNDIFYVAALNSADTQGSFFYTNENSLNGKESVIFDNQDILLNESIRDSMLQTNNILNETYNNDISTIRDRETINENDVNGRRTNVTSLNVNENGSRYKYPSATAIISSPNRTSNSYSLSVNRYSYPRL
jgi:hypothetical protein